MNEERFTGSGGLEIVTRSWRPSGAPRAVVVIVHGFNSHGAQYAWVAGELAAAGFVVHAPDMRGRGLSAGKRFTIRHVSEHVADVAAVVRRAKAADPGLPVFVLGHSAGGVISCSYALDHQEEIDGLVCESFAFRVPAPRLVLLLVRAISHVAPGVPVLTLKNADFSRDPAIVAALDADPLTAGESQPAVTVAAMSRADDRLEREFGRIRLPVLILHGTGDRATLPEGSRMFHERASSRDKTLKLYEGHAHDLLNDIGREQVLGDIRAWIDARVR